MPELPPRRAIAASVLVPCATVLPVFLVGATSVQLGSDLGIGTADLGLLASLFFLLSALGSMPAGWIVERRLGAAGGMRLSAAWAAVCLLGIATASTQWQLFTVMAVAGFGNALSQPSANLLLARRVPQRRQGFYFALKQSSIQGAGLLAGLSVPLLAVTVGWRWAFGAGAALAAAGWLLMPGHVDGAAGRRDGRERLTRRAPIVVLAVGAGFAAAAVSPLSTFLVKAAVSGGVSEGAAGFLLSLASVVSIVSRLVAGSLADRRGGEALVAVASMLAVGSLGYVALTGTGAVFLVGAFVAYSAGWGWPGLFHLSVVRHHVEAPSVATGITQSAVFLGGVVGPAVFGVIAQSSGFGAAWLTAGGAMLAGAGGIAVAIRLLRAPEESGAMVSVCHD